MRIRVQAQDFNLQEEYDRLRERSRGTGAIAVFTGLVRDLHEEACVESLWLEHYPGMTEKCLGEIGGEAARRWPVLDASILHRVGELHPGDQIVLVAVASAHRQAAFEACEFIMDYLKTRAPFWKKTRDERGEHWVEARESDAEALRRWHDAG